MEFTYNGLLRYGFGFANPNHAAAAIMLLLPILWYARLKIGGQNLRAKIFSVIIFIGEISLYVGLLLTYSRAGILSLMLAGIIWRWRLRKINEEFFLTYRHWIMIIGFGLLAMVLNVTGRFNFSEQHTYSSAANRVAVFNAGVHLFAENPLGVGAGNAGKIVTLFYFGENAGLAYRTLVNSFLTFLVEQGAIFGGLLLTIIFMALFALPKIHRRFSAMLFTIIGAGLFNGNLSTCFDYTSLFSISRDELSFVLTVIFGVFLCGGAFYGIIYTAKKIRLLAVAIIVAILCIGGFYVGGLFLCQSPKTYKLDVTADNLVKVTPALTSPNARGLVRVSKDDDLLAARIFADTLSMNYYFPLFANVQPPRDNHADTLILYRPREIDDLPATLKQLIIFYPEFPPVVLDDIAPTITRIIYLPKWDERGDNYLWQTTNATLRYW